MSTPWADGAPDALHEPSWEVRRRGGTAALIGAAGAALAIAFLWRAVLTGSVVDGVVCLALAIVAGYQLATFVDARTPLAVADELGVRLRFGGVWRGLTWESLERVVLLPARSRLQEDRLVLVPQDEERALAGLDGRARRQAGLTTRWYGAPFAVPLGGLSVRLGGSEAGRPAATVLAELADGRCAVEVLEAPGASPVSEAPTVNDRATERATERPTDAGIAHRDDAPDSSGPSGGPRRSWAVPLASFVSRAGGGGRRDVDAPASVEGPLPAVGAPTAAVGPQPSSVASSVAPSVPSSAPLPLRETRSAVRAEVVAETTWGATALAPDPLQSQPTVDLPEGRELRRPGAVDLFVEQVPAAAAAAPAEGHDEGVVPIARPGRPVEPIVIDDLAQPAIDPVIGPEIAASRTRLGLTVDDLAERTRIRPHVLESIEVDDFGPCGGDVYARGHLRTVARVLGMDADALVASFDERYAHAPIDARRVFEAELATGMTGAMRRTSGGPNWTALAAAVLSLALIWGVARIFTGDDGTVEVPSPSLNGSAGLTRADIAPATPIVKPVKVVLTANADTRVVVRDGQGTVVHRGPMLLGERKRLNVPPPVTVRATVPGVVEVTVAGRERGVLGDPVAPGAETAPVAATYRR